MKNKRIGKRTALSIEFFMHDWGIGVGIWKVHTSYNFSLDLGPLKIHLGWFPDSVERNHKIYPAIPPKEQDAYEECPQCGKKEVYRVGGDEIAPGIYATWYKVCPDCGVI
jgi:predicted RNA-binding Zn-ribbon protein involved in translation (DUF1610 family)